MNDFTKEELERLSRLAINASNRFNPNDTDSLCLKIQSMIDNYNDEKKTIYVLIGRENSYEASYAIAASVNRQVLQDVEKQYMSDNLEGWAYIIEFKDGEY